MENDAVIYVNNNINAAHESHERRMDEANNETQGDRDAECFLGSFENHLSSFFLIVFYSTV